jgi:hypothetical protein
MIYYGVPALGWTHASKYLLRSVFRETAGVGRESGVGIIRLAAKEADPSHMLRRFYGYFKVPR